MLQEKVVCKSCGLIDDYRIERKANQQCAYCNGCGAYIKNIPYVSPKFYIGKYKGKEISDVGDSNYMKWYLENVKVTPSIEEALLNRISEIEEGGR